MNPTIEKLGAFYLGRPWNQTLNQTENTPVMLDSRHLVTHAVCLGMTGSGKTGLGIALLEEAAIDGIPAIVIDPKGDMTNLALSFPNLLPTDFEPWIDPEAARLKGVTLSSLASETAAQWQKGLGQWDQDGERIARYKTASEVVIYTPGNTACTPISILKSFDPPPAQVMAESDLYGDMLSGTVSSLLTLLEIDADPLRSREHILLTTILDTLWRAGQSIDLPGLIKQVQKPPFSEIGVFDIGTFYPVAERMKLAMALNNLLASPDFSSWIQGPPMQIENLLYSPSGKPQMAIISIAHLDDRERMFVVSLLLNRLITWMRSQSGTGSLRALFYMDELFGFLPPVAQPPSKKPLMTLLKQARAFGLGLVLSTQNPVDIDYKALSNIGIWMIGRLQTEQDRARLLDGLKENPAFGDKQAVGDMIAGLQKRVFLMHNVHENGPYLFQSRWCLSYLSGPLTREQIKRVASSTSAATPAPQPSTPTNLASTTKAAPGSASILPVPPLLPPTIQPVYLTLASSIDPQKSLLYRPAILGYGSIYFSEPKMRIATEKKYMAVLDNEDKPLLINWDEASELMCSEAHLKQFPNANAQFFKPPTWMTQDKELFAMQNGFREWLFRSRRLELLRSPSSGLVSLPDESERDFRSRLKQQGRENRDGSVDSIRQKYEPKIQRLQKQIESSEIKLSREQAQSRSSRMDTAVSVGATILSAFMGKKLLSQSSIGRASTSLRRAQKIGKESQDVGFAQNQLSGLQDELLALQEQLKQEIEALQSGSDPLQEPLETIELLPKKLNISIRLLTLCWLPHTSDPGGGLTPAWQQNG